MTAQRFREYARQLSLQTIDERIVELARAAMRDPRNAEVYEQQEQLLREEVQRRSQAIAQHQERFRNGVGSRGFPDKPQQEED